MRILIIIALLFSLTVRADYVVSVKKTSSVADGTCWILITVAGDELNETWDDRVKEADYDADYEAVIAPLVKRRIQIRQTEAVEAVLSEQTKIKEQDQVQKNSDDKKLAAKITDGD